MNVILFIEVVVLRVQVCLIVVFYCFSVLLLLGLQSDLVITDVNTQTYSL